MEYTFPIAAKEGDIIHYWVWAEQKEHGETLTDQTISLGRMHFSHKRHLFSASNNLLKLNVRNDKLKE